VIWNIDPVLVHLGPLEIRYYGVCFAIGLLLAARAMPEYFEERGLPRKHAEALTLWMPVAMILGAHFVHLAFYEPHNLTNFSRVIAIGSGLASHGGGLGAILAVLIYAWIKKRDPWVYFDAGMCVAAWVIPWVRVGNFFNSEIVGREWHGPWAIRFPRHDCVTEEGQRALARMGESIQSCIENVPEEVVVPRHPSQVYEALLGFGLTALAVYLQKRWRDRLRPGATFMLLILVYFTTRILVEYVKEYQFLDPAFPFTRGQQLSLPFVLIALGVLLFSRKHHIRSLLPAKGEGDGSDAKDEGGDGTGEDATADDEAPAKPRRTKKRKKKRK
jgi:phosphatidylglycerol:prolipoprotein diacylglycerol transferase